MVRRRHIDHALLCAVLISGRALAQEPASESERVQIIHRASASCPSGAAFEQEVHARVRRPVTWVTEQPSILVSVGVEATDHGALGHLQVDTRGSAPTYRDFEAETCAEVSAALALVVALTLDPSARTGAVLTEPPPAPPSQASPTTVVAQPPRDRAPGPPRPTNERRDVRLFIGPAVTAGSGYDPSGLVALGAVLGARWDRPGWFAPTAQLIPLWGETGTTGPESVDASFTWLLLRLDACPTRLELAPQLSLAPCATGEAGRVVAQARPESVAVAEEATRPWAAAGLSLGLRWTADRWFLALAGSGLLPFVRDEFVFLNPRLPVHRAPAVIYSGTLGAGVEL